jgi:hypothetical protein
VSPRAARVACVAVLWPLLWALGCIQDVQVADGGAGPSEAGLSRADAEPGRDAPRERADAEVLDGASPDTGGLDASAPDTGVIVRPPLTWAEMLLPPNTREIEAIWARSPTELFAVSGAGFVYRLDATGAWTQFWRTDNNEGLYALTGDATHLHLAGNASAWSLDTTTMVADRTIRGPSRQMHAIVPYAGMAGFLVGYEEMFGGVLGHWNAGAFTDVYRPVDASAVFSIYTDGPRTYFGTNREQILVLEDRLVTSEPARLPAEWGPSDRAQLNVRGILRLGGELFAVGRPHMILRRGTQALPEWTVAYSGDLRQGAQLWALAGGVEGGVTEAFAVGDAPQGGGVVRYDGTTWAPVGLSDRWMLRDIVRVSADRYYAVGFVRNGLDGVILRGAR